MVLGPPASDFFLACLPDPKKVIVEKGGKRKRTIFGFLVFFLVRLKPTKNYDPEKIFSSGTDDRIETIPDEQTKKEVNHASDHNVGKR